MSNQPVYIRVGDKSLLGLTLGDLVVLASVIGQRASDRLATSDDVAEKAHRDADAVLRRLEEVD